MAIILAKRLADRYICDCCSREVLSHHLPKGWEQLIHSLHFRGAPPSHQVCGKCVKQYSITELSDRVKAKGKL